MNERLKFQETVVDGIVERFNAVGEALNRLQPGDAANRDRIRKHDGTIVLQAPTGSGKTLMAIKAVARTSAQQRVLWFWFAPFAGLIEQARDALQAQAPQLKILELAADRRSDAPLAGGVFITTWAAVAARSAESRKARTTGDEGLALDAVIEAAREQGIQIGCVVDEAHHGFHRAAEARRFFTEVLRPDFTLMMTATPRDRDALAFQHDTGYQIGDPADWASVSRFDGVEAGLLKRGVRVVRFLAQDGNEASLIDFEHLALKECAEQHRRIKKDLSQRDIPLTPLMLVQVPNGKKAMEDARSYLTGPLGFSEEAVRIHTADEPDADLIALANDPEVEVLMFKLAVALGFDAPRAFTLAALRGARDPSFGVQVIGRILRVHRALRGRPDLPAALDYGYVFLANAESQEGLLAAGEDINALTTQAPETGTQTVITVMAGRDEVQIARSGVPMRLSFDSQGQRQEPVEGEAPARADPVLDSFSGEAQNALSLAGGAGTAPPTARPSLALDSLTDDTYRYKRRQGVPPDLLTEALPPAPADIEQKLATFVNFTREVLGDRERVRAAVRRQESDIFQPAEGQGPGEDIYARLEPKQVAQHANQLRLGLVEADQRELIQVLLERFSDALKRNGFEVPSDEETLNQQLDLILVRNPRLLKEAFRRARAEQVQLTPMPMPGELSSTMRLETAERNAYGVMPPNLGPNDETMIARMLDADARVLWWHRNDGPGRVVGLYEWDEGRGYYPDFIVAIRERETPEHIALLEVKGAHLIGAKSEVEKAGAVHQRYGRVLMVGRERGSNAFNYLRAHHGKLIPATAFDIGAMRWKD